MTEASQDQLYQRAAAEHGAALARLSRAHERDPDKSRDLEQEIHFALWRSFASFDGHCTLRTWVYRVAHNVAASHVKLESRRRTQRAGLETLDKAASPDDPERAVSDKQQMDRLMTLIHGLETLERQIMILYLEDLDAAAISDITGLSPGAVATRIHRIKALLSERFNAGGAP